MLSYAAQYSGFDGRDPAPALLLIVFGIIQATDKTRGGYRPELIGLAGNSPRWTGNQRSCRKILIPPLE